MRTRGEGRNGMLRSRVLLYSIATLALICGVVGAVTSIKLSPAGRRVASPAIVDPWINSPHDFATVRGPVRALTLEDAELSTDSSPIELSRHPQIRFHYGRLGRLDKSEYFTDGGNPATSTVYSYDDKGRLMREAHLNALRIETSKTLYEYDAQGRPAVQAQVDADDGTIYIRRVFTYSEGERATRIASHRGERLQEELRVLRDPLGQIVETHRTPYGPDGKVDPSATGWTRIVYDEVGNIKTELSFKPDGRLVEQATYSYEYDAHSNWVKRITDIKLIGGDAAATLRREVTYRNITYN